MPKNEPKHPMQPLVMDDHGVVRFKANKIVRALLDTGKLDMNDIASLDFPTDDRVQFAQLIGYSVSGAGDLSYMPADLIAEADRQAEELIASQPKRTTEK
jgi:hypothetical protein